MKQPIYAKSASVEKGKSTVVFEGVSQGFYAILCFHDEIITDEWILISAGCQQKVTEAQTTP
jgi:hypothetical protein